MVIRERCSIGSKPTNSSQRNHKLSCNSFATSRNMSVSRTNVRSQVSPLFSTSNTDQVMIEAPRSSAVDFIMKNLQAFYIKHHANNPNERPYVFGGFVRDKLLDVEPTDMDIFASRKVIKDFVEFLRVSERLVAYRRNVNDITSNECDYFCFKIKVEVPVSNRIVNIDLVTHARNTHPSLHTRTPLPYNPNKDCDFTCNNLIMYHDGTISSRVPIPGMSRAESTLICIRDAMTKKLNNMYKLPEFTPIGEGSRSISQEIVLASYEKYLYRTQKMQSKGFVLLSSNDMSHIYPVPSMSMPLDASTLLEEGQEPSTLMCAICRCDYDCESIQNTVVCECGHHYHRACIHQWRRSGRSGGALCPTCRSPIAYRFQPPPQTPTST